jgi:xylulokinase
MTRPVVLGIDSSTQSTKVLAVDLETGEIVAEGRAAHSGADTQNPSDWWNALRKATRDAVRGDLEVQGLSVSGQQHGCVLLDDDDEPVRPAPLWNNNDAASDAERLNAEADFVQEVGILLVSSITIAKLAHINRTDPDSIQRATRVGLPHDFLNLKLTGALTSDRGDSSGTGWWSPATGAYRRDLLELAIGKEKANAIELPEVRGPEEMAGTLSNEASRELGLPSGIPVGPGTGDNMAAALGVGAASGEYVISLGTSGTAFAITDQQTHDRSGTICGFADATGHFMPLVCLINCTRTVDAVIELFGLDRRAALDAAATAPLGANGLLMEPYFGGERTPILPDATGTLHGMTLDNLKPELMVRAALEGVAAGLAYGTDHLAESGITATSITLVGGGSSHPAWQQAIADATGMQVQVRGGREHAGRGAALQAAAIVRREPLSELVARWRPEILATIAPRSGSREAFRLDARRALIEQRQGRSQA